MKILFLITAILLIQNIQASDSIFDSNVKKINLIESSFSKMDSLQIVEKQKISGFRAALYSAVIPGAGQYYTESYWRAALYATFEIAAWTTYFIYDGKGNKKDEEMRDYGDEHWIEQKYWSKIYYEAYQNKLNGVSGFENVPDYQVNQSTNYLEEYSTTIVNSLRKYENTLGYSHNLPTTRTQQYYEMIYKYPQQFAVGWSDAGFLTPYSTDGSDLPATARYYRNLRNLTEEYFDVASGATMVVLVNHVISALDAALAAKAYNSSLQMRFTLNNKYLYDEKVKMYGLQFTW